MRQWLKVRPLSGIPADRGVLKQAIVLGTFSSPESEVESARLSLTIVQFTAHAILNSNTQSQQARICKS